jgi:hypothetical protein
VSALECKGGQNFSAKDYEYKKKGKNPNPFCSILQIAEQGTGELGVHF